MKRRDFTRSFGRAYDGPRLRNPFFAARPVSKIVRYFTFGTISAALLGIPLTLVYAPFMHYDTVTVNGVTTVNPDDVRATVEGILDRSRLLVIPGHHLFFANTSAVAHQLDEQFHFEHLAMHREGRGLVIDVEERITEVAWTVEGMTYFVDLQGIAARDATPEALAMIAARRANAAETPSAPGVQPTMPIIDVEELEGVTLGANVIAADRLTNILALDRALRDRELVPQTYTLESSSTSWLTVILVNNPSLMFDITTPPDEALAMYDAFVHDRGGDLSNLLYIDLRFGNHIYSKNR